MQGLFNLMAAGSFVVSASLVGGGAYLFFNKDKIVTSVVDNAKESISREIGEALPGLIQEVVKLPEMPSLPKTTGPALPF